MKSIASSDRYATGQKPTSLAASKQKEKRKDKTRNETSDKTNATYYAYVEVDSETKKCGKLNEHALLLE